MGELTTTTKPNSAHLVQAALHEAKAAVYGVGALGAGVVTMATLPLTRLATWTEYLFGKYRGGNAPAWNHYLARVCTVPTDIAARTALHFLRLRQVEHEKSEMVYAPASEWVRIFGDDAETWSMGYDTVRNECLEMKMMLPERSYVYQGGMLNSPMKDENGVQIVPAATMTAGLMEMIARQIELLQEKWEAYVALRHTPEIVIRPAAAFVDPLPMAIQEKAAPKVIETVEEEGRWISAPPVLVPDVVEEKRVAETALVVVNAPVVTATPAKPFLKTFTANLSTSLDRKTTKLRTRIGDAVRAAKARRDEKRRLQAEAPLAPTLKLIPVVEAPKALEAPKVLEEAKVEVEAKVEETVIILPPPPVEPAVAEEAKEEVKAEETTAGEPAFLPSFLQFEPPAAEEAKVEEVKAEETPAFVPSFLQFDMPAAEEAKVEETKVEEVAVEEAKAEEEPKTEAAAEEPAFVPSFLQFEAPVVEEAVAEAEAFPVEEIKTEATKAEAAPAASLSLDMQVTDITPAMLRQALDKKAKAAQVALTAILSLQVTDITPEMLKNASPVKAAAPAVAVEIEAAPIVLQETEVVVEAELPSFLKPAETPAPVEAALPSFLLPAEKSAPIEVDAKRPAEKHDTAKRDAEAAEMAARAAAFLFPPSVAAEISLQPALMPETAAAPKKRIGKTYNFSSNDDRTTKLPPIMSLPRGVIVSQR